MTNGDTQGKKVNICRYKVKEGKEDEMVELLAKHHPALRKAGLATADRPLVYRGLPSHKEGGEHGAERVFIEIFSWSSDKGPELAHQSPEVMAVWEPMGAICEEMDFPSFSELELPY